MVSVHIKSLHQHMPRRSRLAISGRTATDDLQHVLCFNRPNAKQRVTSSDDYQTISCTCNTTSVFL